MAHDIALFVYGSLKLGFRHANVLAGARRAGVAMAAPYVLVRYRGDRQWQRLSFSALKVFERADGAVHLDGGPEENA